MLAPRRKTSSSQTDDPHDIAVHLHGAGGFTNNDGSVIGVGLHFSMRASAIVEKMSQAIDELNDNFMHYLLGSDVYESFMKSTQDQLQQKFADYLKGDFYQEKIKVFSEIGVTYLGSAEEKPDPKRVNIHLTQDDKGLPLKLTINLPATLHSNRISWDFSEIREEQERIKKYHLTYFKDFPSLFKEIDAIKDKLHESSDTIRLQLLNDFNTKWQGQLTFTYEIDHTTRVGKSTVTDASGKTISTGSSNHVVIDRTRSDSLPQIEPAPHSRDHYNLRSSGNRKELTDGPEQSKNKLRK